ncbi:MAG TPA: dTDP-4-dehydrorhamnose reductase [Candidatus Nanoarchaeia archaeon]|nr:dTDP-4-dehydrorhamnose reductase [Candidatus Nanoarchaeia archaeon]
MKVLVTGAAGMLGSSLCPILTKKGHKVIATDLNPGDEKLETLDVRSIKQMDVFMDKVKPDIVMHLAAETDVDRCEVEPDHAYHTNTIGTQNVVLSCQKRNTPMVYISTIGVFYGDQADPYTEFDNPNPINIYGRSKLEGEKIVQSLLNRYYIVRAGWMVGGGPKRDKKFIGKIIRRMNETNLLKAVNDKIGSPTYTVDFSRCLADLVETNYYGLYHCTNKGYGSRFDVAKKIVEILGRSDVTVEPVSSAYFPLPAARARSEMSRNYKLELLGMDTTRNWEDALKEYIISNWK